MTWRTMTNEKPALYYLISWPEEDDVMSVVADHMIVSPPAKEIIPGVMCKVKGFEKNLSKVVAAGTKAEMNSKLDRIQDSEDEAIKPPKKKARLEGKENKVPPKPKPSKRRPQNKKEPEKRRGTIITVGSKKNPPQASAADSKTRQTSSEEATKTTSAPLSSSESEKATKDTPLDLPAPPSTEGEAAKLPLNSPTKGTSAESAKDPTQLSSSESEKATKDTPLDLPAPPSTEGEAARLPLNSPSHRDGPADGVPATTLLKVPEPEPNWYKKLDQSILEGAEDSPHESRKKSDSSISRSGSLLLELTVDDHDARIQALEATVEKLMKIVETLQSKSEQLPQQKCTPPPPLPPRCPIRQQSRQAFTLHAYESYRNEEILLAVESSPPPLPPPLPSLSLSAPPPVPLRCSTMKKQSESTHPDTGAVSSPLPTREPSLPPNQSTQMSKPKFGPTKSLPSSCIDKTQLKSPQEVLNQNSHLVSQVGKMTTLAVVLAREAFFGDHVMGQCTAKGHGDKPALPHQQLMELKDVIKGAYPQYWKSPHEFESQWNKCTDQISQACKRARNKTKKRNID